MSRLVTSSLRAALALAALVGVLEGPWWLPIVCVVVLAARFRAWEVLFIGLVADFMWLPSGGFLYPFPYFTLGALVIVWAFEPLRRTFLFTY